MRSPKILNISSPDHHLQDTLHKNLPISKLLAQLLINRGIKTTVEAERFLFPHLDNLCDPHSFQDMDKVVRLIKKAALEHDKVLVFSDYDVDDLTSLAILKTTLEKIGIEVLHYIPNRVKEGYGLNRNILEMVKEKGVKLLITADCGTNSDTQVNCLIKAGVSVIVTDHHEPMGHEARAHATAIINPKLKDSGYAFRELAGVGVAYKVCQAVLGEKLEEELDMVALGTIADAVPLVGENRIIAREGLLRLSGTERIGLRALMESSGIKDKKIIPSFVSFILGPRLNASGRIDTAEISLDLLLAKEYEKAKELAKLIETHNRQRQKIESAILQEAHDLIDKEINFKEHNVMVVAKEGWHTGVLGIVAAKLAERFYRPTILISLTEDICKGSGRSIKNFHLFEAILECKDLLESFGGHQHATGLALTKNNLADFKHKINRLAKEKLTLEDLLPSLDIDIELRLKDISFEFLEELKRLQPFGIGNREPLFYTRHLRLKGEPRVFSRDTIKFWVTDGEFTYPAIGFGIASFKESLLEAGSFDLVYSLTIDDWQGEQSILLEIKEMFFK